MLLMIGNPMRVNTTSNVLVGEVKFHPVIEMDISTLLKAVENVMPVLFNVCTLR